MRRLALFALLAPALVLAQVGRVDVAVGPPPATVANGTQAATTADLTLYVDPTGSDANACTASGASACATPQGAVNKVPKLIRDGVTVNLACGDYYAPSDLVTTTGLGPQGTLSLSGIWVTNERQAVLGGGARRGYLHVQGDPSAMTVDLASQTATAGATQTVTGTITVGGAAWTVDAYKGKFLRITGGTSYTPFASYSADPNLAPIVSNDATTITFAQPERAHTPAAATTFEVVSPCVRIHAETSAGAAAGIAGTVALSLANIGSHGVDFDATSNTNVDGMATESIQIRYLDLMTGDASLRVISSANAFARLVGVRILGRGSNVNSGSLDVWSSYFSRTGTGAGTAGACLTNFGTGSQQQIYGNFFDCAVSGTSAALSFTGSPTVVLQSNVIRTTSAGAAAMKAAHSWVTVVNGEFTSAAAASSGILATNNASVLIAGLVTGSNGLYGIKTDDGGHVQILSTTTITGTSGDTSLDAGVSATSYAAIRAASPTSASNPTYMTRIWQ